jgi:HrpA-like RNA helicase
MLIPFINNGRFSCLEYAGAILIFVSGMAEIKKVASALSEGGGGGRQEGGFRGREYADQDDPRGARRAEDLWVLALHSLVSVETQRKVFDHPPRGRRKVIVSTNIAETSVTIDDVR